MSYKIGLILSMVFVALFFLFGADLISLQSAYSTLDAKANNIAYIISRNGRIDSDFISYIETTFSVDMTCDEHLAPTFGEQVVFEVSTNYSPLVIGQEDMVITIKRMTIIGFYG